jgi:hypothetical protein
MELADFSPHWGRWATMTRRETAKRFWRLMKKKREKVLAMANVTVMTTARGSGAEEQSEGRRSPLSLVFYSNVANHNSRCVVMFLVEGGLAWATKVGSRRILVNIGLLTLYLMMTLFGRDFLLCWLT